MTEQRSDYPLDYAKGPAEKHPPPQSTMDRVKDATAEVQGYAGKVADQAREYADNAREAAHNFKPYVERSMKEQPMTTLAIASVIGFVLGALWKK